MSSYVLKNTSFQEIDLIEKTNHTKTILLVIGLSLLLHIAFLYIYQTWFKDFEHKNLPKPDKLVPIKLTINTQVEAEPTEIISAQPQQPVIEKIEPAIILPQEILEKPVENTITEQPINKTPEESNSNPANQPNDQTQTITPRPETEITNPVLTKDNNTPITFDLDNLRKNIRNNAEKSENKKSYQGDTLIFNPNLQNQISEQTQKKLRQQTFLSEEQRKQLEEYYDFNLAGNEDLVRINGKCYQVTQTETFDEFFQPVWTAPENCSNKKKLDLTRKPVPID